MSDGSKTGDRLSRRKMIALALSGTAAGIAGCMGDGGGGTETPAGGTATAADGTATPAGGTATPADSTATSAGSPSETTGAADGTEGTAQSATQAGMSPDQMADATVDMNVSWLPQNANWNHHSNGPASWFWTFDYTSNPYWNGETDWWLLEDDGFSYNADDRTATFDFREEYGRWWNGDPVTAEDYYVQREIERLQDPEGSPWESWTMEDDYTLVGKRKDDINPILLGVGSDRVFEYRDTYRQWLEQYQDATTASERESITSELNEWSISTEQFVNEGLGNSTYRLDDWSTTQLIWEKFEDHPYADQAPFPTVRWRVGSGSSADQQVTQDRLDAGIGRFEQQLEGASPDYLQTIYTKRSIQARNLLFNYNNKHIGRRNVRRALISILDFNRLVGLWSREDAPVKQRQSGLPKALEDRWLGEELMNQMYEYPLGSDPEQASTFMERAGYTKQGGTWVGPDGDSLSFTLMIGTYKNQEPVGQAMVQRWNRWGANPELMPVTNAQWTGKIFEPTGDWDLTIFLHGFDVLNPMNFFKSTNPYHMRLGSSGGDIARWLEEGETHSPLNGKPLTPTIPSSPGLEVGDDGGQQINIYELVQELRVTQSEERSREIIRTLSRYFNYDLPMFDMFPQVSGQWGDTKNFAWPDDADTWYQKGSRAMYNTFRKGVVGPVSADQ